MSSESEFRHIKAWCECAFANAFIVENSILSQLKVESGKANEVTQYICGHRACSFGWLKTSHATKIIFYCLQWHEVYAMNYMPNGYLLLSLYVVRASQSLKTIRICKSVKCYLFLAFSIQILLLRWTNRQMSHRYSTAFNRFESAIHGARARLFFLCIQHPTFLFNSKYVKFMRAVKTTKKKNGIEIVSVEARLYVDWMQWKMAENRKKSHVCDD